MRDLVFIPKKFVYDVHRNKQRKKEMFGVNVVFQFFSVFQHILK